MSKTVEKIPPHSEIAEKAVLGAMLISEEAISKVIAIVSNESFYIKANQVIYKAIYELYNKQSNVDIVTVAEFIRTKINGSDKYLNYLVELNSSHYISSNVENYALILQEMYFKRKLIEVGSNMISSGYDESKDAIDEVERAESIIFKLAESKFISQYSAMPQLVNKTFDFIERLYSRDKSKLAGVPSGIYELDKMTAGFQKSDMIVVAARPSMGKTALALTFALNAAKMKVPVAVFSIEMAAQQLMIRLIAGESRINQSKIRSGMLAKEDIKPITNACSVLSDLPLFIDDTPMLSVLEFRAKCRRLKSEHNIGMVVVDYLQIMHAPKSESREREIAFISNHMKAVAKELDVPVIVLAQLNRQVDSRADKRPMLSDLRESGTIEQDADLVMFVNRPEVYGQKFWDKNENEPTENTAEIIIGKQRNGAIGEIRVAFLKDLAKFDNLSKFENEPMQNYREVNF